jgi:predicted dehydrogenase
MLSRILIVGLGSIGKRHLKIARELYPEIEIAVFRHKTGKICPKGANFVFSNISDAKKFNPDIVVISNPASKHIEVAKVFAQVGAHLFIEKPLSISSEGVLDLLKMCNEKNVKLITGYNLRFSKSLRKFKSLVDQGYIGDIWTIRCEVGHYLPYWRKTDDYTKSVTAKRDLGGGVLLELSHEIDYINWIFGKILWVQGHLSNQSNLKMDVEDSANLIFGLSGKKSGRIITAALNMDCIRRDRTRVCIVIGESGSLKWDGVRNCVESWSNDSKEWEEVYCDISSIDETYYSEWADFISAIDNNRDPLVNGEEALKVLNIIEASKKSSDDRKLIDVEYLKY